MHCSNAIHKMQEKAGEDAAAIESKEIQYTSLKAALQSEWALLDRRRSNKLICILQGMINYVQSP